MKININKDTTNITSKELETKCILEWEEQLLEYSNKEEIWDAYEINDVYYHVMTIKEIPILEKITDNKITKDKIYNLLIDKIKKYELKIKPTHYIKEVTYEKYNRIVNKNIKKIKENIDGKLFEESFLPKIEEEDLILQIKEPIYAEFYFLIIKNDKIISFCYSIVVD